MYLIITLLKYLPTNPLNKFVKRQDELYLKILLYILYNNILHFISNKKSKKKVKKLLK